MGSVPNHEDADCKAREELKELFRRFHEEHWPPGRRAVPADSPEWPPSYVVRRSFRALDGERAGRDEIIVDGRGFWRERVDLSALVVTGCVERLRTRTPGWWCHCDRYWATLEALTAHGCADPWSERSAPAQGAEVPVQVVPGVRVPNKPKVIARWYETWLKVKGEADRGRTNRYISDWLQRVHPELKASPELVGDIIAAGRRGLLNNVVVREGSRSRRE